MLVDFKVENFRSFQSEQTFSLVASKDTAHPGNLIGCEKLSLLKAAAIYGPNASGKSTLLNALKAMQHFVTTSATQMNIGDWIASAVSFRLDDESMRNPSRFAITLLLDGTTYFYCFSVTAERVYEEMLDVRKAGGRISHWFERRFDPETQKTNWKINGPLKRDAELLRTKTRDNGLSLSRGAEFNIQPLVPLFRWFRSQCLILDLSDHPDQLSQSTAKMIAQDASIQSRVMKLLNDADFGIEAVAVQEGASSVILNKCGIRSICAMGRGPSSDSAASFSEKSADNQSGVRSMIQMAHLNHDTGESRFLDFEMDESNGTRRFFSLIGPFLKSLDEGSLLVVDELDCSMHPLLTRKLVEFFQSRDSNDKGAQLVFTTHDSSMMDSTLLRRDQIWLTEKRRNGATDLYSLFDFELPTRPRKSAALEKNYLTGRYGGLPKFGPSLEYLEYQDVP